MTDKIEPPKLSGRFILSCPNCGVKLDTDHAENTTQTGRVMQFCGVRCEGCGKSFTVEATAGRGGLRLTDTPE